MTKLEKRDRIYGMDRQALVHETMKQMMSSDIEGVCFEYIYEDEMEYSDDEMRHNLMKWLDV